MRIEPEQKAFPFASALFQFVFQYPVLVEPILSISFLDFSEDKTRLTVRKDFSIALAISSDVQ